MEYWKKVRASWDLFWIRVPTWIEILISTAVVALIAGLILLGIHNSKLIKYVFTPEESILTHGRTPEEVLSDNEYSDVYSIDKHGNLIMTLTKEQKDELFGNHLSFVSYFRRQGVDYSVDYTTITIDANKPILLPEEDYLGLSPWALGNCIDIQVLRGVNPSEIEIEFIAVDYTTGETVYQATWPHDVIEYTYQTDDGPITYGFDGGTYYIE